MRRWIAIATVLAFVLSAVPMAASAAGPLPLSGTADVTAVDGTVTIDLAYRSSDPITRFRVSLAGPSFNGVLFETVDAPNEVAWSGSRAALLPGVYTVTVTADVRRAGGTVSGSAEHSVTVGGPPGPPTPVGRTADAADAPFAAAVPEPPEAGDVSADVVIYGGTPSGVMAALGASRPDLRVVLVEPTQHVGGMMSNGLNATDYGHTAMIGGFTRAFFDRMEAAEGSAYGRYRFQPSIAERVFETMLAVAGVELARGERLDEGSGVIRDGTKIRSLRMESGRIFSGTVFIDASYEGDLMADAGVSYRLGREASSQHGESFGGVRPSTAVFTVPSGIDPAVPLSAPGAIGSGDERIQNSNYRLCFSTDPKNQVPFTAPEGYSPGRYDLASAYINARLALGHAPTLTWFLWPVALTNNKFDVNNNGLVSIGVMGANAGYPDGTYRARADFATWLRDYTAGMLYFLRHDDRVPSVIRNEMARYGLCADEFTDNDNWPRLLYLREGRRMVGAHVLTQRDVQVSRTKPDTVAIASYAFDSHHVSRWIDGARRLRVEGGFWNGRPQATRWSIPYRSLTPRADEVTNLLVSVTASATHVGFTALRLEPQYMLMGEAAGAAASMVARSSASAGAIAVQAIDVAMLQQLLRSRGSIIDNHLFWDIAQSPFRSEIERTFLRGVTFGCSAIYYCPSSATTREVMAGFLANALRLPPATRDYFSDDASSPHQDSINRVAAAGITGGCATGRYCPTATVTRGQMAAFLVRAFKLPLTSRDYFTDDAKSIFQRDINRLAASGITGGCGGTRFCPNGLVTREQMAAFLWRAVR